MVISDGVESNPSLVTYPIQGFPYFATDRKVIPFADGHTRQLPKLTGGPFDHTTFANSSLIKTKPYCTVPINQAAISHSAISLADP